MSPGTERTKVFQLLGLAHRAGAARLGTKAVRDSIRRGLARLVLIADDAADGQLEKIEPLLGHRGVEWRRLGSKDELGEAVGRSSTTAISVEQDGFASRIIEILDS